MILGARVLRLHGLVALGGEGVGSPNHWGLKPLFSSLLALSFIEVGGFMPAPGLLVHGLSRRVDSLLLSVPPSLLGLHVHRGVRLTLVCKTRSHWILNGVGTGPLHRETALADVLLLGVASRILHAGGAHLGWVAPILLLLVPCIGR